MSERHRPGVKMKLYIEVDGRDKDAISRVSIFNSVVFPICVNPAESSR